MKKDKCAEKYCREKPAMNFLGRRICMRTWEKICNGGEVQWN